MKVEDLKDELRGNPGFRREYSAEDLIHRVAENVLRLRTSRGLSQHALAEQIGSDQSYIAHIEAGNVNLTLRRVAYLAYALGVDPAELTQQSSPTSVRAAAYH